MVPCLVSLSDLKMHWAVCQR